MTYVRLFLVSAVAGLALAVPGAIGASANVTQPLLAQVGDPATPEAFRISLTDATGARVTHLDPGTYTINVRDYGKTHNFHLFGPGVQEATDIEGTTTTTTWVATFGNGTYRYQCDAHPLTMRGSFTSGTLTPPVKKLFGTVGPRRTISLRTASGARARRLTAGRYRITVRDLTSTDNFHLIAPGVNRKTSVRARLKVVWTVRLRAGKGRYRSDAHRSLRGSFTIVG